MRWSTTKTVLLLCVATLAVAADFETPPTLEAKDVLAPDVIKGDHYEVRSKVVNNGYMDTFVLDSDFGDYEVYGEVLLHIRIHEVGALAELDGLSKSQVFVQAVGEGAIGSLRGLQQIATNPVKTVKGVPQGVGRFFKRGKHRVEEGYGTAKDMVSKDDGEEGADAEEESGDEAEASEDGGGFTEEAKDTTTAYAKKYFGVNAAQRRWAQKLEVDPYSSNEVLREAIADVADVDAAGRFAVRLAPIPRVPGARYANTLTSVVWSREPWELVEENTKALVEAGASEEKMQAFLDNVLFSPSQQTAFVRALLELGRAENLDRALEQAATAASDNEARFFVHGAALLRWFHHKESPVVGLLDAGDRVFVATTADDRVVVFLPVDDLFWIREIGKAVEHVSKDLDASGERQAWLTGRLSPRAAAGFEELGWSTHPGMAEKMKADPVQTTEDS